MILRGFQDILRGPQMNITLAMSHGIGPTFKTEGIGKKIIWQDSLVEKGLGNSLNSFIYYIYIPII